MQLIERVPTRLAKILEIGIAPDDDEDLRTSKATVILVAIVISALASVWVVMYFALGRPLSASIPLAYQAASVGSLIVFVRTKRFRLLRFHQLAMMSVFPFLLQWSLGGYAQGSAVSLWAVITPVLASMFGARPAGWIVAFLALSAVSGAGEPWLSDRVDALSEGVVTFLFVLNAFGPAVSMYLALSYFNREREANRAALAAEKAKSEALLLNILPEPIAERLKSGEQPITDSYPAVTVMFVDIVGFTSTTARMKPSDVTSSLDGIFSALDDLSGRFGLEKIKTIGDGYQAVAGAPVVRDDHAEAVADMALAVMDEVAGRPFGGAPLRLRIGIDTGPVVAAVIGKRKFSYDMWGDVVNTASRMESHGVADRIQVTETVHGLLRDRYGFEPRGPVDVKGMGSLETYFLVGRR